MTDTALVAKVAEAIAHLVPLDDGSQWAAGHAPIWPKDYSRSEIMVRRAIATVAVEAIGRAAP